MTCKDRDKCKILSATTQSNSHIHNKIEMHVLIERLHNLISIHMQLDMS